MCEPGRLACPEKQWRGGRTIKNVDELMEEKASKSADLIRAEIIGVVLYTGPMVAFSFSPFQYNLKVQYLNCCNCDAEHMSNNNC